MTKSGKTLRIGFFAKVVIAILVNSTPLELSLRSIATSVSEIFSLLSDDARTIELEKLQSKGVAMRACVLRILRVHVSRRWAGSVDVMHRANEWRRKRQGYDVCRHLSAYRSKKNSVSQFF